LRLLRFAIQREREGVAGKEEKKKSASCVDEL